MNTNCSPVTPFEMVDCPPLASQHACFDRYVKTTFCRRLFKHVYNHIVIAVCDAISQNKFKINCKFINKTNDTKSILV